jgi:asparagine synthetase B (glutamine-hydrolysing)
VQLQQKKNKLKTFSIGFISDANFDETQVARKTADFLNAEHHELLLTNDDLIENLESCLWHTETPNINLHYFGKYLLSKLASEHVKVVLTGEGADELFLGYDFFKNKAAKNDPLAQPILTNKRFLQHPIVNKIEKIMEYPSFQSILFNRFIMFFKSILLSPPIRKYINYENFRLCRICYIWK